MIGKLMIVNMTQMTHRQNYISKYNNIKQKTLISQPNLSTTNVVKNSYVIVNDMPLDAQ